MTTGRKFFSGNSLEIALMQAARHHGLQPEEVAYRKIEKRHGFLRSRKGVVIEVDPESPRLAADTPRVTEQAPAPTPEPEAPVIDEAPVVESLPPVAIDEEEADVVDEPAVDEPAVDEPAADEPAADESAEEVEALVTSPALEEEELLPEATEDMVDAARRGLQEIMDFAKLNLEAEITRGEGQLEVELSGRDRPRLVEDRGNLLLAIQHLLPRLIRGYTERSIPCHVDSEAFHASREAELEKLAVEAAEEVREGQRPRTLPPMNPAERRIIHVTLADEPDIATESQGKGFFKRVTITPGPRRPRGFDRY